MNDSQKIESLIREYIQENFLMQLATVDESQPWITTLHYAEDRDLNLYWISSVGTRHSQELQKNNRIAAAIVKPHTEEEDPRGIQLEGVAEEIIGNASRATLLEYAKKFGTTRKKLDYFIKGEGGNIFYKLKPTKFYLYDEVNFPDNPKQELIWN